MNIGFYVESFTYRGTFTALFDYAYYNQTLLHNKSIIIYDDSSLSNSDFNSFVFDKCKKTFDCRKVKTVDELKDLDLIYCIKYGKKDVHFKFINSGIVSNIKTVVHCVFCMDEQHGDVYAGVSNSVAKNGQYPFVDHVISLPDIKEDLRGILNIPKDAIVLGRLGGTDTFNIPFVKNVIEKIIKESKTYFLFATLPEMLKDIKSKYIISMEPFFDSIMKRKFINTCNAMIHASELGESQGLNILEFSYCNKPVITWNGGKWHKQHLSNLGDYGVLYNNEEELYNIIMNIDKILKIDIDFTQICIPFSPEIVMNKFKKIFID